MTRYVLHLTFKNNDRRLEVRPAHREYLKKLHAEGRLVTAGPWGDETGAMLIYEAADEAEVRQILADDPYTPADVYDIALLKPWHPLFP